MCQSYKVVEVGILNQSNDKAAELIFYKLYGISHLKMLKYDFWKVQSPMLCALKTSDLIYDSKI